jgi:hypothetical protein
MLASFIALLATTGIGGTAAFHYPYSTASRINSFFALYSSQPPENSGISELYSSQPPENSDISEIYNLYSTGPPPRRRFQGRPSTPGWAKGKLNGLTDWAVNDEANRPVMSEYDPDGLWLWTRWDGTVLYITIFPVLFTMLLGAGVDWTAHSVSPDSWPLWATPPADDPLIQQLQGLSKVWGYQLTLCTFILTFFSSQAYSHWRMVYSCTRAIQGRINDICLLLTVGAERDEQGYTHKAADLVETCTRLIRLSHTFFWAATPTMDNGFGGGEEKDFPAGFEKDDDIGPLLLSQEGLARLVAADELTQEEMNALIGTGMPPSQYAYILLEWVGLYTMRGLREGSICCDDGFEQNLLRQFTSLRAEYFNIGDYQAGRMPLAYVQLVQVLVDSLVYLAPFALYAQIGTLSIPLVGLLAYFFKGILELSKSFLDPFGVEGFPDQNIRVDVLVSELNFGAASRWVKAGAVLPSVNPSNGDQEWFNSGTMVPPSETENQD